MRPSARSRLPESTIAIGAICAAVLLTPAPALAAPATESVTVSAPEQVDVGDAVGLQVALTGGADIYAYELTAEFDPQVLQPAAEDATGPAGGFDDTAVDDGVVTVVHSRLGTSPALDGDLAATVPLTGVAPGTSTIKMSVTLIGADGSAVELADAADAVVEVAAPVVSPTPTPTPAPSDDPSPTPSAPDDSDGSDDDTGHDDAGAGPGSPNSSAGDDSALPSTGAAVLTAGLIAAATIAVGALLLAARAARLRKAGAR